jgi:hypothetical protein
VALCGDVAAGIHDEMTRNHRESVGSVRAILVAAGEDVAVERYHRCGPDTARNVYSVTKSVISR